MSSHPLSAPVFLALILAAAAAVAIVHLFAILGPGPGNWGAHHYAFLPASWVGMGVLVAVAAGGTVWIPWNRFRIPVPGPLAMALGLGGAAMVFWTARERVLFLGDGALWVEQIREGRLLWHNEPGALWLIFGLNRITGSPDPSVTMAAVSVACGVVYVGLAYAMSRLATTSPSGRLAFLLVAVTAGFTRLFYGYVETYPVLAAGVMLYLFLGALAVQGRCRHRWAAVSLLVTVPCHVTALALVPSLFFLLPPRSLRERLRSPRFRGAVGLAGVLLLGGGYLLLGGTYGGYLQKFMPLAPGVGSKAGHTLQSAAHVSDFFQEQILVGPFAALLAMVFLATRRLRVDPVAKFLLLAGIPWWIFSFLYGREIGPVRDWDLFAAASVPLALFVAWVVARHPWHEQAPGAARTGVSVLTAVSMFHLSGFVASDLDPDDAIQRYTLLHSRVSSASIFARTRGLEEVFKYHARNENREGATSALREAHAIHPGHERIAINLATLLLTADQTEEAKTVLGEALSRDPDRGLLHYQMAFAHRLEGDHAAAAASFRNAIERSPDYPPSYIFLSRVYREMGETVKADSVVAETLRRFPENPEVAREFRSAVP